MKKVYVLVVSLFLFSGFPNAVEKDKSIAHALKRVAPERIKANVERLAAFGTRHTASEENNPTRGVGAARRWILSEMKKNVSESGGRLEVFEDWFEAGNKRLAKQKMANVVAVLRGDEGTRRVYVIGGHYDSRVSDGKNAESDAPGADDDASGVAVTMELLRVMAPLKLRATVVFAAFVGEEQGLFGSTHLAERLKNEDYHVDGMLTLDIVGSPSGERGLRDAHSIRCFSRGLADVDSASREWARYVEAMTRRYVRGATVEMIFRLDRYGRGGDHIPFEKMGWPAARLSEKFENYSHEHQDVRNENGIAYGDRPEFVDAPYMGKVARVAGAALLNAASAPAPPQDVQVRGAVAYDSTLTWSPSSGASGYVVVYRQTTSPRWEHEVPVRQGNKIVLKNVVVDNFIFGVKSVDAKGRESRVQPAVFSYP